MPSTTQKFAAQTPATSTSPLATRTTSDPVPQLGDVVARFAGTRQPMLLMLAVGLSAAAGASLAIGLSGILVLAPMSAIAFAIWALPPPVVFVHQSGIVWAERKIHVHTLAWTDVARCVLTDEGRERVLFIQKSRQDTIVIHAARFAEFDAIVGHLRGRVTIDESAKNAFDLFPRG